MAKNKWRIFMLIFSLLITCLSTSMAFAQANILDIRVMAVFQTDDGLQAAINQTGSVSIEIYDGAGNLIKLLEPTFDTGGIRALGWNATGSRLAAIYAGGAPHPNVVVWDVTT